MFIDPRHYYEQTFRKANEMIAHECFHWYRHRPYHLLMKMLGVRDDLGRVIRCAVDSGHGDTKSGVLLIGWNGRQIVWFPIY